MTNQNYRRKLSCFVNAALAVTATVLAVSEMYVWTGSGTATRGVRRSLTSEVTPPTSVESAEVGSLTLEVTPPTSVESAEVKSLTLGVTPPTSVEPAEVRSLTLEVTPPVSVESAEIRTATACIVFLVTNKEQDVNGLKIALKSLAMLKDNQSIVPTPVLVFNEGNLDPMQKGAIIGSTSRTVSFPEVNLNDFPSEFNPDSVKNVTNWRGYQEMRFWVSDIWKHSALGQFTSVMRMSSESCFNSQNDENLPSFESGQMVYHGQYDGYANGGDVMGLMDFTEDYMRKTGHIATNPMLWQFAKNIWSSKKSIPTFNTNFEIVRKPWMQHPDVAKWRDAVVEQLPDAIFRYQWSDPAIKYLTTALFSTNYRINSNAPHGYAEKDQCNEQNVKDGLLAKYML